MKFFKPTDIEIWRQLESEMNARFLIDGFSPRGTVGMQDVEVGHADFDQDFIIKGNDNDKLKNLFSNDRIRELIAEQPDVHFALAKGELCFHVPVVIREIPRLKKLFNLFSETLEHLCQSTQK